MSSGTGSVGATNGANVEDTIAGLDELMNQYAMLNDAQRRFSAFMTAESTGMQLTLSADAMRRDGSRQTATGAGQMAKEVKNMSNELTRG